MSRSSLYKALSEGAKPQFSTIMKVLKAIGGQYKLIQLLHKKRCMQTDESAVGITQFSTEFENL